MKIIVSIALSLIVSFNLCAQKRELKKVEKAVNANKYERAKKQLELIKPTAQGTEYESYLYFLLGKNEFGRQNTKKYPQAIKYFNQVLDSELTITPKDKYSEKAISFLKIINSHYFSKISNALSNNNFNQAGKMYQTYANLFPERRDLLKLTLYSFQNAKNKEKTVAIAEELLHKDTEGISYNAINKQNNKKNEFFKKEDRDKAIKQGTHEKPTQTKIEPKIRIDYYNVLVRTFDQNEEHEKTLALLKKAQKEFPNHVKFFEDYATVASKIGDKKLYATALEDVLKLRPENRDLWINLGITKQELNDKEGAISAYDKAIEVDPNFAGAYINKALVILSEEQAIIDELNNHIRNKKKHKEISEQLHDLYTKAIPPFEKAYELKPSEGIKSALISMYNTTNQKEKAAALK